MFQTDESNVRLRHCSFQILHTLSLFRVSRLFFMFSIVSWIQRLTYSGTFKQSGLALSLFHGLKKPFQFLFTQLEDIITTSFTMKECFSISEQFEIQGVEKLRIVPSILGFGMGGGSKSVVVAAQFPWIEKVNFRLAVDNIPSNGYKIKAKRRGNWN